LIFNRETVQKLIVLRFDWLFKKSAALAKITLLQRKHRGN